MISWRMRKLRRALLVDDEVGVALAEPRVGVGEAVPLVGHRAHGLGQQLDAVDLDAELALARGHHRALDADPVAEVELAECLEPVVADHRLGDEQLDLAVRSRSVAKINLPCWRSSIIRPATLTRCSVSVPGSSDSNCSRSSVEGVRAVEPVRVRVGAGVAQCVDLVEPLGLLRRQPAPGDVWLEGWLFVTHKGMTVPPRRCCGRPCFTPALSDLAARLIDQMLRTPLTRTVALLLVASALWAAQPGSAAEPETVDHRRGECVGACPQHQCAG